MYKVSFMLETQYAYCMFLQFLLPSSGGCVTKNGYVEILQLVVNQSTDVKIYCLKLILTF